MNLWLLAALFVAAQVLLVVVIRAYIAAFRHEYVNLIVARQIVGAEAATLQSAIDRIKQYERDHPDPNPAEGDYR